jgi:hypothetical protein
MEKEADLISETFCFLTFRIPEDGQVQKKCDSEYTSFTTRKQFHVPEMNLTCQYNGMKEL